ncbi:MAG: YneF family protein [bacterium]
MDFITILTWIGFFVGGLVVGFIASRIFFKRYLAKNPPVNENMIRAMMGQMGRTPSEKQVRQVMASMNAQK